jgi:large subunit ribosomal protein L11e
MKYDPNTGIYGMDFFVVLRRDGKRVDHRKKRSGRLGTFQLISNVDAQKWFTEKLGGTVISGRS